MSVSSRAVMGELRQHLLGVVLFAVEAAVNHRLHPLAQRRKQGGNDQRGNDNGNGGLLTADRIEHALQQHHQSKINQRQQS